MQGTSTAKAPFPSFIPKTDEERIQNLIARLPELKSRLWTVTEKLDGTSFTCYSHEGDFGVCSRNWELNKEESSVYWQIANRYNLKEKLAGYNLAIQGEILAPGIQGNKYKVEQPDLYVFNVYMINDGKYMYPLEARNFCDKLGLKFVPLLDQTLRFQCDVDFLLQIAEGKSKLNPAIEREGLVYVTDDGGDRISFKVISNKFLLKED
jgi:RNA ligase (TIGR02306 family)